MSGGHLERLEAFASGWQSAMDDDLVSEVIAVIDGRPLRKSDLGAALDELKKLRAERADQVRLARSAYASGWTVHAALAANAVQRMSADLREQSARDYADEIFPAQAAARSAVAPQQPERDGGGS